MDKSVAVLILHNDIPPQAGWSEPGSNRVRLFGTIGSARPEGLRPTRPDPAGLSTTATPPAR